MKIPYTKCRSFCHGLAVRKTICLCASSKRIRSSYEYHIILLATRRPEKPFCNQYPGIIFQKRGRLHHFKQCYEVGICGAKKEVLMSDVTIRWLGFFLLQRSQPLFDICLVNTLTLKHRETHGCVVSTVATDALVLKHQAISILSTD